MGATFWPLALARELDDAILHLRSNEAAIGILVFRTEGDADAVLSHDTFLAEHQNDPRRLGIEPADIAVIVLSHGHWDHVTGMDGLIRRLGSANVPVLIHPEFWSRRRLAFPGREPFELPTTSPAALRGAGFEIVEDRRPSFLLDGALLVTDGTTLRRLGTINFMKPIYMAPQ